MDGGTSDDVVAVERCAQGDSFVEILLKRGVERLQIFEREIAELATALQTEADGLANEAVRGTERNAAAS